MQTKTHAEQAGPVTPEDDQKQRATVYAIAAQSGVAVFQLADGSFLATRWGLTKPCPDLRAVLALARQLGGV